MWLSVSSFVLQLACVFPLLVRAESQSSDFICDTSGTAPVYNASSKYLGCYLDRTVSILQAAKLSTIAMTPQFCTNFCGKLGYKYAGVEFTTQCFCGIEAHLDAGVKTDDSSCNSKCVLEPEFFCGATYIMSLYEVTNPLPTNGTVDTSFTPVCQTSPLCSEKVCNTSLSKAERIESLVKSLTREEKIHNLVDAAAGSARLGLPSYEWWNEALHGVGSSPGVMFPSKGTDFSYATSFGSPILTAASFNDALIFDVAKVIGKESRAFGNYGFSGFDFWTPDINPFRDPRWGRGQETPGEDAFHVQNYIRNLIPGLQGDNPEDKQIIATCKHFAAYDMETGRYGNNYNPSHQDLADYYLAPFKTCVRDANVGSVMCAYNSVNGIPSCANEYLLEEVLRQHWNFTAEYNYVVSDCSAIDNIALFHNFTDTVEGAAAVSINAGTDLDCGQAYIHLNSAIESNYTTEAVLDRALTRLYWALFTVGYFDGSDYGSLSFADVGTAPAKKLAYEAAVQGITLLKNDGLLPLHKSKKYSQVAMIGPYANATTQMQGNYAGTAEFLHSPWEAFQSQWKVNYALGTSIKSSDTTGFASAISAAKDSDLIFYLGGIDNSIESETLDRTSLSWPGNQLDLISELTKLGKPLVVVQFGGGQLDDSALLRNKKVNAILWAGYPGQDGGPALLDIVTGKRSVAGRLPVTQYPESYADEVSIFDIRLRPAPRGPGHTKPGDINHPPTPKFPGRTYKWYTGKSVLPFGHGLHYTKFDFSWGSTLRKSYDITSIIRKYATSSNSNDAAPFETITATVRNIGHNPSDYVGLVFISSRNAGPAPRPNKSLVSYARLQNIPVRGHQKLELPLTLGSLARADENGSLTIYPGDYTITLDIDAKLKFHFSLRGKQAVIDTIPPVQENYNFTVPVRIQPPSTSASS